MSAPEVYHQVSRLIKAQIDPKVDESSVDRLCLLVTGMIKAKHAAPAQIANALKRMQLTGATAESLERRIRRAENDPEISASLCFHPFARAHLLYGHPKELLLILDPTTQEDRIVMVSVAVWYRGRALPLAWATWAGNTALQGDGLWKRIEWLLEQVAGILPANVSITLMADRAFGCPVFIDLLVKQGWHFVLRVQGQTVCQDRNGHEQSLASFVPHQRKRKKLRGKAFKKKGWREVSVVCYWGRRHKDPLCLVSDLRPGWELIALYRRRFPIEATFRDYKSCGWRWEQGQVKSLAHVERLLVAMALATWIVLMAGAWQAAHLLSKRPTGHRRTLPRDGKRSLFFHGLEVLQEWILDPHPLPSIPWILTDWDAPTWSQQILAHHANAFIRAL